MITFLLHPTKNRIKMRRRVMFYLKKNHIFPRFLNITEEKNNSRHASNPRNAVYILLLFIYLFVN